MINQILYEAREVSENGQRNKVYAATAMYILRTRIRST